jgi:hypothetical protein
MLLSVAAPGVPAARAQPGDQLAFRVSRNARPIGSHVLSFDRWTDGLGVRISVDITVDFGPITLYRYRLRAMEQWRDGRLSGLHGTTDDDGTAAFVEASREPEGLWVKGSAGPPYRAPHGALPGTHWNKAELNAPWINPQDGKLLRPTVRAAGVEELTSAAGQRLTAERFELTGEVTMTLWYATDGSWAALQAPAKDGSRIRYDRL